MYLWSNIWGKCNSAMCISKHVTTALSIVEESSPTDCLLTDHARLSNSRYSG